MRGALSLAGAAACVVLAFPSAAAADAVWWSAANDPVFSAIMTRAATVDEVRGAKARAEDAAARFRAARGVRGPNVALSLDQAGLAANRGVGTVTQTGAATISAPLDLNGALKFRARAEAARAEAANADVDAARLTARTSAGRSYIAFRTARAQITAAERAIVAAQANLRVVRSRARAGLESRLAVAQAEALLAQTQAALPALEQSARQSQLRLESLLGDAPGSLRTTLQETSAWESVADVDLLAYPAGTMLERPDIRAQAARLTGLGLDARAARADRLPTLSLSMALNAFDSSRSPISATGGLTGALASVFFDGGRLRAFAQGAEARARAAGIEYERTVRVAAASVEVEADRRDQARRSVDRFELAVEAARREAQVSRAQHRGGLAPFTAVALAEQRLAQLEQDLARAKGAEADAVVGLADAIGLASSES